MKYLTRTICLLLFLVSLQGCYTAKSYLRKFPPETSADTIVKHSVRDSLVYRDTTITVSIPGETIIDSIPIPCPDPPPEFIPDTLRVKTEFAAAKVWYSNRQIKVVLTQAGTLQVKLDSALRESYEWREKYEQILKKEVVTVKAKVGIVYKIALGAWILVFVLILLAFLRFLRERYFPKVLP